MSAKICCEKCLAKQLDEAVLKERNRCSNIAVTWRDGEPYGPSRVGVAIANAILGVCQSPKANATEQGATQAASLRVALRNEQAWNSVLAKRLEDTVEKERRECVEIAMVYGDSFGPSAYRNELEHACVTIAQRIQARGKTTTPAMDSVDGKTNDPKEVDRIIADAMKRSEPLVNDALKLGRATAGGHVCEPYTHGTKAHPEKMHGYADQFGGSDYAEPEQLPLPMPPGQPPYLPSPELTAYLKLREHLLQQRAEDELREEAILDAMDSAWFALPGEDMLTLIAEAKEPPNRLILKAPRGKTGGHVAPTELDPKKGR